MVNLKSLEDAVAKVERIRDHEFCFEIDGIKICLMPLRPDQETEAQKYAQIAMEAVSQEDGEAAVQANFADFMDRFRQALLAFAIVQIGSDDLRGVHFIETGKQDKAGNPISVPKWEALCSLIAQNWSRMMLSQVYGKYAELLERLEIRAQKAVSFEPVDLEEEIERTTRRLTSLKEAQAKIKSPDKDQILKQQQAIRTIDKTIEEHRNVSAKRKSVNVDSAIDTIQEEKEEENIQYAEDIPVEPVINQGKRQSSIPQVGTPVERTVTPQESPEEEYTRQKDTRIYKDERGIILPEGGDSFFDPTDPGNALKIEAQRQALLHQHHLAQARAREEEAKIRRDMGMPSQAEMLQQQEEDRREQHRPRSAVDLNKMTGSAPDKLRQAVNTHDAVLTGGPNTPIRSGRPAQPIPQQRADNKPAELHGKPVFRAPTQVLEKPENTRQHGEVPPGPVKMNAPVQGGRNPNFRGPQR